MVRTPNSYLSFIPVRAVLISIMCDLPATRKVCCSKCFKEFKRLNNAKPDYSVESWSSQSILEHRKIATLYENASTTSAQEEDIRRHQIFYSP